MTDQARRLPEVVRENQRFLWGLCYRLTGCAADADELVQETFARAVAHPPARPDEPWRPWLVRVAVNLGRDLLRRRRRQAYDGPWLPSPVETDERGIIGEAPDESSQSGEMPADARYGLLESVTFAFLIALEALSPLQRAALVLRDVLGYSAEETGRTLGLSPGHVRITHLRARRALAAHDRARRPPAALAAETREALVAFVRALGRGDVAAVESLMAESVRLTSDAGGEFAAARLPILGRNRVARFYLGLLAKLGPAGPSALHTLNGLPALVGQMARAASPWAPRFVVRCDLDDHGHIVEIHSVQARRKLTAVPFAPLPP